MASKRTIENLPYSDWEKLIKNGRVPGKYGEIEFSIDGKSVRCHLCGRELKQINNRHIVSHGLENADAYRELLGLRTHQSLASPDTSDLYSKKAIKLGLVKNILGKGNKFVKGGGEKWRQKDSREQAKSGRRAVLTNLDLITQGHQQALRHRCNNEIRKSWKLGIPNQRVVHQGRFGIFGVTYFFSKLAHQVSISITDIEVIAKGKLNTGQELTRQYPRKDVK